MITLRQRDCEDLDQPEAPWGCGATHKHRLTETQRVSSVLIISSGKTLRLFSKSKSTFYCLRQEQIEPKLPATIQALQSYSIRVYFLIML